MVRSQAQDRLTIGALAAAADVGVETVRYYQRRELMPVPAAGGGFRRYGVEALARLRFIRRAQALGFTLEEIGELLQLHDGTDRRSVRRIAQARLSQLQTRIDDMQKMASTLQHLIHECEHAPRAPRCPIIASIEAAPPAVARTGRHRRPQ
jgi:MerR family mercuric resistance operon transcriptional regulator